jgi:hypothetical protein
MGVFSWLESTEIATAIRESTWLFPTIETVHVFAIVLVVGSVMIVDLRLLNVASRERSVTDLTREVLPWTWAAFALAALSGGLLFTSSAMKYVNNLPFRFKMVLLLLAGVNMLVFHRLTSRSIAGWDRSIPPTPARVAGGLSLLLWFGVISLGRWIGFTT